MSIFCLKSCTCPLFPQRERQGLIDIVQRPRRPWGLVFVSCLTPFPAALLLSPPALLPAPFPLTAPSDGKVFPGDLRMQLPHSFTSPLSVSFSRKLMSILLKIVTAHPLPQHAAAPFPYDSLSTSIYHPPHPFISSVCSFLSLFTR